MSSAGRTASKCHRRQAVTESRARTSRVPRQAESQAAPSRSDPRRQGSARMLLKSRIRRSSARFAWSPRHLPGAIKCTARRSAATLECRRGSRSRSSRDPPEQIPGRQRGSAKQHREGVMVDVAGLQAHRVPGDIKNASRYAVWPESVDDRAVSALPEQATDSESRTDEQEVIEFVEVPLVEQEAIEGRKIGGEPLRCGSVDNIHVIGDEEPTEHEQAR